MTAPQKYIFDESFNSSTVMVDPIEELKADFARQLEEEKAASFERGKQEGEQAAAKSIDAETKNAIKSLVESEKTLRQEFTVLEQRMESLAIEFGITAGTKLAATLLKQQPMDAIEEFFRSAFTILKSTPKIKAKLHPQIIEPTKTQYEKWAIAEDWEGSIDFIADESLAITDVAISWDEGGVSRSVEEMIGAIQSALSNFSPSAEGSPDIAAATIHNNHDCQNNNHEAPRSTTDPTIETIEKSEPSS